jgi:hypothetical protein
LTILSGISAVFFGFTAIVHTALPLSGSDVMCRRAASKSMRTIKPANMNYIMRRQEITGCYTAHYQLATVIDGGYI